MLPSITIALRITAAMGAAFASPVFIIAAVTLATAFFIIFHSLVKAVIPIAAIISIAATVFVMASLITMTVFFIVAAVAVMFILITAAVFTVVSVVAAAKNQRQQPPA